MQWTYAQSSSHISIAQGLSTNQLTILVKAKDNSMWIGSYNGLQHHEGTSVKVYKKNNKDSTSLSSNEMHSVFEDSKGFIWVGTTGELTKLDPKTGRIKHYKLKSNKRDDNWIGYIYTIFEDDKDHIWVSSQGGLFVIDVHSGKFNQIMTDEHSGKGLPSKGMLYKSSVKTKTGIWMFVTDYIVFFDFKTQQFFHKYNNPHNKEIFKISQGNKSELCIDGANNLYFIFNNTNLYKYNLISEKIDSFQFALPKNAWRSTDSLAVDYRGNVWMGFRYGGVLVFDQATHKFTSIRYQDANSLIKSDYIYSLSEDYLKRMWISTDNGIFVINYYDNVIHQQYLSAEKELTNINYLPGVMSQDDNGNIYIPFGAGGLYTYNVFSKEKQHFKAKGIKANYYKYVYVYDKNKLNVNINDKIFELKIKKGDAMLTEATSKIAKILNQTESRIVWMHNRSSDEIYLKKDNGSIYFYNGTDRLKKISTSTYPKQICVSEDMNNIYFLSDQGDLIRRNMITLKIDTFLIRKKLEAKYFAYTNMRDIGDDGKGNIWITSQNGLIKFNINSQIPVVYNTDNGLLHDFSFTLCRDSKNRLWVGSMGGVNLFDPINNRFINVFAEAPDKLSNYFGSSIEGKDGHIYFLFGGQIVNVNPEAFLKQKNESRILNLNEVLINGKTRSIKM